MPKNLRVALVCDWLTAVGGAESVLLALHQMYPEAPIYTSKYDPKAIDWFDDADVRTGYLQKFPNGLRRFLGPLRQRYFSHLDLSDYDLVISVTGAEAKAVKTWKGNTPPISQDGKNSDRTTQTSRTKSAKTEQTEQSQQSTEQDSSSPKHRCIHLCYCHVPTQYYWGMYDDYIKNPGFGILNPLARLGLRLLVKPLRGKDFRAAKQPDQFITISTYAADLIKKYYKREAVIINPPANLEKFAISKSAADKAQAATPSAVTPISERNSTKAEEFSTTSNNNSEKNQAKNKTNYITTSRQVNWKRLDLCIKACLKTGDNLTLIGNGPEHGNLARLAGGAKNIRFLPTMPQAELAQHLAASDAFLFPSLEPFGLAPVEAMAAGIPVLAYQAGGALDYIEPEKNGLFFESQSATSMAEAMSEFRKIKWSSATIKKSVARFDQPIFKQKMQKLISEILEKEL